MKPWPVTLLVTGVPLQLDRRRHGLRRLSRRSFLASIPPFGFEQGIHHAAAIHQRPAEFTAAAIPGTHDVAQGDGRTGQFLAHRPAEKLALVEYPDLRHVARIVT